MKACPTPKKRRYKDGIAAKFALADTRRKNKERRARTEQRAYPCPSGRHWHLTSD